MFRAGVAAAAITVAGAAGLTAPAAAAVARDAEPGGCGPLPDDPHFAQKAGLARTFAVAEETSYNGWPVGTPASAIGVTNYTIRDTTVTLAVKSGDVANVLMYVAGRFHREVEALRPASCGGWEYRRNVNNTAVWSNHASGTAIDLNWDRHPNGAKGTFTASQVSAIRGILAYCGDVVYWGGDYRGTTDEMHFELDVPPGDASLARVAAAIRAGVATGQRVALRARANGRYVCADNAGATPLIANRTGIGTWEQFTMLDLGGGNCALRSAANNLFVCADGAGGSPLIANRPFADRWETFQLVRNGDGTVSLRARANGQFVCAEGAGNWPLIANRNFVEVWERFDLVAF